MAVVTLEEYKKQQEEEEKKKKKKEKNNTLSIIDYTDREYSYDFDDFVPNNTENKSKRTNNSLIKKAEKGNVLQQIGGTIGDITTNVGKGFFNTIEGVTDFGENLIASAIGLVAGKNNKASNWLRNNANVNSTGAIFGTNERNDENLFKKGWTDELDKYSVSGNILDSVAQGVGQIGAYVGLAGAGGGTGATASKGGLLTRTGLSSAKATALSTFTSSYGNTLSTMRNAGYDDKEARTQALISGLSETISEQFFDGIPGLKTAGWGDKLTGKIRNSVGRYLGSNAGMFANSIMNALGEGSEEVLSNIFTTLGNDVFKFINDKTGNEDRYINQNYSGDVRKDLKDNVLNQDTLDAFISASLTSAILNGASNVMSIQQKNKMFQDIAKEKNISVEEARQNYENTYKANAEIELAMQEVDKRYTDLSSDERNTIKEQIYNTITNGIKITDKKISDIYNKIRPNITQNVSQETSRIDNKEVKNIKKDRKQIKKTLAERETLSNEIKEIRDIRKNSKLENKTIKKEISTINKDTKDRTEPLRTQLKEVNDNLKNVNKVLKEENKKQTLETKQKQFDIVNKANPMLDDYHTGIRSAKDIKTWKEVLELNDENEGQFAWGDYTREDAQRDLEKGTIKVYSSKPIKNGNFVSTSLSQAKEYAGGGKVYSKEVKLSDVAWLNGDEGQYATTKSKNNVNDEAKNILLKNADELNAKQQELKSQIDAITNENQKKLDKYNKKLEKSNKGLTDIENSLLEKNELLKQNKKTERKLTKNLKSNITKQVINSDTKITLDVADGSIIEATKGIDLSTKKGKKYEKQINKTKRNIFQKDIVSRGYAVEDLANATGNNEMLYKFYERTRSTAKAEYDVEEVKENVFDNLKTKQQKKDFAEYTYLKLNAERLKKGKSGVWTGESAIDEKTSKQMAKELEKKYPNFRDLSNELYEYLHKLEQKLVDSGFISEDAREFLYDTYVPTIRELAGSKNTSPLLTNARSNNIKSPIKSAKGSEREIVDLEKAIALTTIRNQRAVDENNARKELLNSVGGVVGGERLSFDETHNTGNNYQMSVYKDGRVITMTVSQDIAEAYTPTKYYEIEKLTGGLRGASKYLRGIFTNYNPIFQLIKNPIRDAHEAFLNTRFKELEYTASLPEAAKSILKNNEKWQEYKKEGGVGVGYKIDNDGTIKKENVLTKIKDKYNNFADAIEQVWRFNEYLLTLKHGGTKSEALYNASDITVNFARGGDVSKALDRNGALFLNASIQGFDKQIRNFKENGARGAVRLLIRGALLSLPYWFNQATLDDDKKYQKISDYTKQNNYIIRVGDTYFKIPRGRALSVYTTALQDMWETAGGRKKIIEALQSTGSSLAENLAPNNPLENNIASPIVQALTNKNYYGNKIVSDYMEKNYEKADQYDEKTDMISRYIGEAFNFSPKKVNYVIDQYTGYIGDIILPQLTPSTKDTSNVLKKTFIVDTDTTNQSYFDLKSKQESYEKEVKNVKDLSNATTEQRGKALASKYIKDIKEEEISPLYDEINNVRNNKNLDEREKALQVEELYNKIYEISKSANDDADAGAIYRDYAVVGHYEYRMIRKDGKYIWSKINNENERKQQDYFKTYGVSVQTYYSADRINRSLIANSDKEYDKIKEDIENIKGEYKNSLDASNSEKDYNKVAKKREVFNYINNLNLSLAQKAMLMKQEYSSYDDYDKYIFDYINNSNLTYDEKTMILLKNGFKYNKKTGTFK